MIIYPSSYYTHFNYNILFTFFIFGIIIFIQRFIKIYLSRDDYDTYDYPKIEEYFTKQSNFLPHKESILYLQSVIKYYLYRQKIRINTIHKKVINPLKCTKTIKTNTEKIFGKSRV